MHVYEVRPRRDKRGVDLISDVLPFQRLWYGGASAISNAIGYAKHRSRSHESVIRVYDPDHDVIETHERKGDFKEWQVFIRSTLCFLLRSIRIIWQYLTLDEL